MSEHQFGFDTLLQEAAQENIARQFDRETAHLPGDWDDALAYHRQQIADHHRAMLEADFEAAHAIQEEARLLAQKLNGGMTDILAHENAPGCKLDRAARAAEGDMPLWGQSGAFEVNAAGMAARVEMVGLFGIGTRAMAYSGFSVRAVYEDRPFLSATGYRSFLCASVPPEPGMTPACFAARVIEAYVRDDLRGKLLSIDRA